MLPLWRLVSRAQGNFGKGIYSSLAKSVETPVHVLGQTSFTATNQVRKMERDIACIEGFQGEQRQVPVTEARRVMQLATEYQCQGPSIQGTQGAQDNYYSLSGLTRLAGPAPVSENLSNADAHSSVFEGLGSHVSLNGCMQSTVPHPLNSSNNTSGYRSYLNMPGGGGRLLDKYVAGSSQACHPSRNFTSSTQFLVSQQGAQDMELQEEEYLVDPTPQGIQGDNCVRFKLWMENCQRYNLPNCDEQLESIKSGRKTLAQVFQEQQEIIRLVAENYKNSQREVQRQMDSETNAQGQQDYFGYSFQYSLDDPCPQGLQGDGCATFKMWAHNCHAFGLGNCSEKLRDVERGRRSLQDVFDEQDQMIRKIVSDFQQKRSYSTSSKSEVGRTGNKNTDIPESSRNTSQTVSSNPHSTPPIAENVPQKLSQKEKLKQAVKQYGGTVIVFHIGISLISLGGFYVAVSSGLDVVGILTKVGVGEAILQSKIATGSTTFVVAYAVHKVFAPVRIAITLSCTPFIVRYLRHIGFLKPPKIKAD